MYGRPRSPTRPTGSRGHALWRHARAGQRARVCSRFSFPLSTAGHAANTERDDESDRASHADYSDSPGDGCRYMNAFDCIRLDARFRIENPAVAAAVWYATDIEPDSAVVSDRPSM